MFVCQFDDGRADFLWSEEEKLNKHNLTAFINENSLELVIPFSKEVEHTIAVDEKISKQMIRLS